MFAYQLLRGCAGASGHIRAAEGRRQVTVRGLPPGTECAFYVISGGRGVLCGQARADHAGQAEFSVALPEETVSRRTVRLDFPDAELQEIEGEKLTWNTYASVYVHTAGLYER